MTSFIFIFLEYFRTVQRKDKTFCYNCLVEWNNGIEILTKKVYFSVKEQFIFPIKGNTRENRQKGR